MREARVGRKRGGEYDLWDPYVMRYLYIVVCLFLYFVCCCF